jgi:uncharacterized protein
VNVSNSPVATTVDSPASPDTGVPDYGVVQRPDGVYYDPTLARPALAAAVDNIFKSNYFAGLDYAVLLQALYDMGGADATPVPDSGWRRFADGIVPFTAARRALYRSVKIEKGVAEYYFEPVYLTDPDNPDETGPSATLDADEFVADLWNKGIRFGIDVAAVRAAIAAGQSGRQIVAARREPVQGQDAHVIEVSADIHRSDAPRLLANGKLDLHTFQNRFPQIQQGVRLLQKAPRVLGKPGFELSGAIIEAKIPSDLDLQSLCGLGTKVELGPDGEFLVAQQSGFLTLDPKTSQLSIDAKIVSHDGVSARTTGDLHLTGDYEEFGEVQEMRVIEGEGITVHADVFGKVVSRGGSIVLNRNLIGGTAINKQGDILVRGVASGATIQSSNGAVSLQRAENCIVSGTKVRIEHAVNCEIMGQDVEVGQAEGCVVAGRNVVIDHAAPRRQSEMVVYVQVPDSVRLDAVIGATRIRLEQMGELVARHKAQMDKLGAQPEVRQYMRLATGVRKNEITLTPEQLPVFQRMAQSVGPVLKEIGKVSDAMKAIEAERQHGLALVEQLEEQRDGAGASHVSVHGIGGDVQVRALKFDPDGSSTFDLPAREIKARLRGNNNAPLLFGGNAGSFDWSSESHPA